MKKKEKRQKRPQAPKGKRTTQNEPQVSLWREVVGWALFFLALIGFVSLFIQFAEPSGAHPFGPWLGERLSQLLTYGLGRLPSILFLFLLALIGLKTISFQHLAIPWRPLVVSLLLWGELLWLLSIRHIGAPLPTVEALEGSGGYLGAFIIRFFAEPLFGNQKVGPIVVGVVALILTLIVGVGFRPSRWLDALFLAWRNFREKRKKKKMEEALASFQEESPAEQLIRKKRERLEVAESEKTTESAEKYNQVSSDASGLSPLDRYTREEREAMSPIEMKRLLEEASEWQLASAQVKWEQSHQREIKFAGLLDQEKQESPPPSDHQPTISLSVDLENFDPEKEDAEEEATKFLETLKEISREKEGKALPGSSVGGIPAAIPAPGEVPYQIPDIRSLLPDPPQQSVDFSQSELETLSRVIELQLANFKVKGKCVGVTAGPVITRFEVELAPGMAVSRVARLDNDLAMALRARTIRIIAPIPGTNHVGIEVPNKKRQIVYYRKILDNPQWAPEQFTLPVALGEDISGKSVVIDLVRAPHLLIAGSTGSGKSVCINALMASILSTKTPDDVRVLLVDPKVVELKPYEKIPHLAYSVITSPEEAVQMLKWSCEEMDRRYEVLSSAKVRNIAGFNAKFKANELPEDVQEGDRRQMPLLLIVIDELADLMMVAGKDVEKSIARIAQKARAVGIHLVLATQRPDSKVITGLIKANLPSRIAFRVAQQLDSRIILDQGGAEKLLGLGDMLYLAGSNPEPVRVHGCFLSDNDVEVIAEAVSQQQVNYPMISDLKTSEEEGDGGRPEEERAAMKFDPLFEEVAEHGVLVGQISTTGLQTQFEIGFSRASRIVSQLERARIVGPARGSKPREVLIANEEELRKVLMQLRGTGE